MSRTSHFGGVRPVFFLVVLAVAAVLAGVLFVERKPAPGDSQPASDAAVSNTAPSIPQAAEVQPARKGAGADTAKSAELGVLTQLIRKLGDSTLTLNERKKVIQALAKDGSPEALGALKDALSHSSQEVRQAIAEGLGECANAEGAAMLLALLKDADEAVAKAAARGLAKQDQPEGATALARLANDPQASPDLRCEAVLALGTLDQPWVLDPLSRVARESDDEDLVKAALSSIGSLDFGSTKDFFQDFLQSPDPSSEARVAAVEALAQAQGDPTAFLAGLAAKDSDADVRAAAAWALSATETTGNAGPDLLAMLKTETDPDVRLRLYQALRNQQSFDANAALADVQKETDPSARIAGLDLVGKTLRDNPSPALQTFFDQTAIPELKQVALTAENLDDRQAAVLALTRARTPQAVAALKDLASQLQPPPGQPPTTAPPVPRKH